MSSLLSRCPTRELDGELPLASGPNPRCDTDISLHIGICVGSGLRIYDTTTLPAYYCLLAMVDPRNTRNLPLLLA